MQEARRASSLNHPNIITIYDIESVDGVELIAMEYICGKPLPLAARNGREVFSSAPQNTDIGELAVDGFRGG